eukprot:5634577-Alexandrium_andersonii.AAC.1
MVLWLAGQRPPVGLGPSRASATAAVSGRGVARRVGQGRQAEVPPCRCWEPGHGMGRPGRP